MSTWITGKIVEITHWTNRLFTLTINASVNEFLAGQFARIGMKINNKLIQRAYSYINSPNSLNLEFYITTVPSGILTNILYNLNIGNDLIISKESYGRFTLNTIPNCRNLWMIATGTGISPYLSILESFDKKLNPITKIILIHATQYAKNLNYLYKMIKLQKLYQGKLLIQTILSQERSSNSLHGHIPNLIENDQLEKTIGISLNSTNSHVMLCGNPNMIHDTKKILNKKYGMKEHSSRYNGHITQERYW